MPEAKFFEALIALLIECDEEGLRRVADFNYGILMDWLYPKMGSENN